jgi:hypothetical protein
MTFGEEVYLDVWGLSPVTSLGGKKYYVSFTDDYSRFTWIQTLKKKSEVLNTYQYFVTWAKTQHGTTICRFHSDRGGENCSTNLMGFLQKQGTEQRLTTHDMPQHNRIAESLNRHLLEQVQALLHQSGLLKSLWGEALHYSVWLKNRSSTHALRVITLYKWLHRSKPNLGDISEWGQHIWVRNFKGNKLEAQGLLACWIGYDQESSHAC